MRRIGFHDRDKEMKEIRDILDAEPSLITFVYGPINSGKTALITHLIEELPEDYVVFYVNLRGKFISNYDDFVRALFKLDREKKEYKEILRTISEVSLKSLKFTGIPVTEGVLDLFFKEKTYDDVFEFLEDYFTEIAKNKVPVLIVDELQKIGDVRINTHLIYELFNLFIRLTKELHLCHVFAVTSDSLFIEQVYSEAMLEGRCRYLMVDDFDYETAAAFLDGHDFTDDERTIAWGYCGGKPVCLLELMNTKDDRKGKAEEMFKIRKGQIEEVIYSLEANDKKMFDAVLGILSEFIVSEKTTYKYLNDEIKFLVRKNIIFADSVNKELVPQSQLTLSAMREVMRDV
ncbi:MAG: ATP-binding protein [Candidatus Methanogaster sp.]|uniref:ATP-binding protein n=1 Tax=Candidatus Methanogaster sp. TaxID=3386292 RepID=A0AC61L438_9EURY|nr:MAG: ATP-binding protein [ANME-2 cluster archaeon]